jgi:hypothetical protein
MSTCSNCYNGCVDIVSDKCVKYTGIDYPILGIKNGDSLSYVEQAMIGFLISTLDGTGIKIDIPPQDICALVELYLPTCGDLTIVDISIALIKTACDLQTQIDGLQTEIDNINTELTTLNADYTVPLNCLTGVTNSSDTHDILQAVMEKVCAVALDLSTNYVKAGTDLDQYIQTFIDSSPVTTLVNSKMIPFVMVPYFGDLTGKFDINGAGTGDWDRIFLCNGANGTPDMRGRVPVGAIVSMAGGALDNEVNPSFPGNPNYDVISNFKTGTNTVTLTSIGQIPSHIHTNSVLINDPGHNHVVSIGKTNKGIRNESLDADEDYLTQNESGGQYHDKTSTTNVTNLKGNLNDAVNPNVIVTINPTGGVESHANIQPVRACYYIMYIP